MDKDAYVRAFARSIILKYKPNFDFRATYLENIEKVGAPAILGIGEIGQLIDAGIIEEYLDDSRIAIVRATLVSLMRLNSEKYKALLTDMLTDSRIGVIKTAQKLILKYNAQNFSRTFEIFRGTPYEYTRVKCAAILFKASKWERLIYMLEALSAEEESMQKLAFQSIQGWLLVFNRSFVQVSKQQKDQIRILIEKQKEKLSANLIRELLFLLN